MLESLKGLVKNGIKVIAVMAILIWIVIPDPIPFIDEIILIVVGFAIVFTDLSYEDLPLMGKKK